MEFVDMKIRVSKETREKIEEVAKDQNRSMNKQVVQIMQEAIKAHAVKKQAGE